MMPFTIKIRYEYIPNKAEKLQTLLDRTIAYAADLLVIESKALCPVDTGRLQNSITQGIIPGGRVVGPDTPYDIYVEFGHHGKGPWPKPVGYMRGGIVKIKEKVKPFMARNFAMLMAEKEVVTK